MATPSLQDIFERRAQIISGPSDTDFASALRGAITEKTADSEERFVGAIEKQRAEIPVLREQVRQDLKDRGITNPFVRKQMIEQRVASKRAALSTIEKGLDIRRQRIENIVTTATEGFKSQVAREHALLDAMQKYESELNRRRQQEFSNQMSRARLALSQAAAARAARKASRKEETSFDKIRRMARERGGDIQINPESGGLILSHGGRGTPLNEFIGRTGLDARDVLSVSLSDDDARLLNRLKGKFSASAGTKSSGSPLDELLGGRSADQALNQIFPD